MTLALDDEILFAVQKHTATGTAAMTYTYTQRMKLKNALSKHSHIYRDDIYALRHQCHGINVDVIEEDGYIYLKDFDKDFGGMEIVEDDE